MLAIYGKLRIHLQQTIFFCGAYLLQLQWDKRQRFESFVGWTCLAPILINSFLCQARGKHKKICFFSRFLVSWLKMRIIRPIRAKYPNTATAVLQKPTDISPLWMPYLSVERKYTTHPQKWRFPLIKLTRSECFHLSLGKIFTFTGLDCNWRVRLSVKNIYCFIYGIGGHSPLKILVKLWF